MTFPGLRVLVVDDDAGVHGLLRDILRFWGCAEIEIASDGQEGVRKYQKCRPDLVLMDLDMPVMNGFEASQAIMTEDRQAIIVMVTGMPDSGLARSALEKGFVRVAIPKPFQLDQLKIAVEEALKKAEPQRVAPAKEGVVA